MVNKEPWTALPVPIDPKLVSFHTIASLPLPADAHPDQTMISFFLNILAPFHGGPSMWTSGTRMHQWQQQLFKIPFQAA